MADNEREREDVTDVSEAELRERFGSTLSIGRLDHAAVWAQYLRPLSVSAGTLVCARGEESRSLFLVRSGQLDLSLTRQESTRVVSTLRAGDYFGELGLLATSLGQADVLATEATELLELTRPAFEAMRDAHPTVARALVHWVNKRIARGLRGLPVDLVESDGVGEMSLFKRLSRALFRANGGPSQSIAQSEGSQV